jgi:hypothetical protein
MPDMWSATTSVAAPKRNSPCPGDVCPTQHARNFAWPVQYRPHPDEGRPTRDVIWCAKIPTFRRLTTEQRLPSTRALSKPGAAHRRDLLIDLGALARLATAGLDSACVAVGATRHPGGDAQSHFGTIRLALGLLRTDGGAGGGRTEFCVKHCLSAHQTWCRRYNPVYPQELRTEMRPIFDDLWLSIHSAAKRLVNG